MLRNFTGSKGGENLNEQADNEFEKISGRPVAGLPLTDLASRELVTLWRSGSQEAARALLARYEVRLIALVASRLNRRYRESIPPEDVVQSAMGSFFRATRAGIKPSLQLESTATAWNILATFTRRKLSRALERETAFKRGGTWERAAFEGIEQELRMAPAQEEVDLLVSDLSSFLAKTQLQLLELLLAGATQKEAAKQMGVDERTIRRRISALREVIAGQTEPSQGIESTPISLPISLKESLTLPNISYREFVLGKMVGRGSQGKVYRARLQEDGQVVAVKFMHRHLWNDPHSRVSFLREIDHASRIDHPGVVKYFGWGQSPHSGPYLVCEYIDGQSFNQIERGNFARSVQWLTQICDAVAASHEAGVIHGDLTPNNVLLADDDRVVITDFGFAATMHRTDRNRADKNHTEDDLTSHRSVESLGGTLGFAAPEQISPAFGRISFATDIYGIGGLAYFFLTGHGPHTVHEDSLSDTIADEDVVALSSGKSVAEGKLARLANAALRKGVKDRPQRVGELIDLLS